MDKDTLITARINDLISRVRDGYYASATGFLDTHEQALARKLAASAASAGVRMFF